MSNKNNDAAKKDAAVNEAAADLPVPEENEPKEAEGSVTLTQAEYDEVKAHIEKLKSDYDSAVQVAQRTQADFSNFRRRNASVAADSLEEGKQLVIKGILPILDDFDRALANTEGVEKAFVDGVVLVHRQLTDTLKGFGLSEIPCDGKFDPECHEAVMREHEDGKESGTITAVLRKGYKVNERIIRYSMVKVAE